MLCHFLKIHSPSLEDLKSSIFNVIVIIRIVRVSSFLFSLSFL